MNTEGAALISSTLIISVNAPCNWKARYRLSFPQTLTVLRKGNADNQCLRTRGQLWLDTAAYMVKSLHHRLFTPIAALRLKSVFEQHVRLCSPVIYSVFPGASLYVLCALCIPTFPVSLVSTLVYCFLWPHVYVPHVPSSVSKPNGSMHSCQPLVSFYHLHFS